MKVLFLIFHGFEKANGISKKVRYQVKALKDCGLDTRICHYDITPDGNRYWMVNGKVLADLGKGMLGKIRKRYDFSSISDYVLREGIELVYIRSYHNANPFTIRMVRRMKRNGAKVVMEIPTYPYDQEYTTRYMKMELFVDKRFRHRLALVLDGIVTFSNEKKIFGQKTIRISNGIDFDAVPLKKQINDTTCELHLLGVAEVHYWHGYDRLLSGLADYYQIEQDYKVYFHIVGPIVGERERQDLLPIIHNNRLEPYVTLHGPIHGAALNECFEQADFAIGSLGRHRSGITCIKTLKNREYAARGLAFTYSETDDDFDHMPYVLKMPPDDSPINIIELINFQRSLKMTPQEIRESIQPLSWKAQMNKVIVETGIKL